MKVNTIISPYTTQNYISGNKRTKTSFEGGKAVYAGSFDPITNGHIDLIKEGSKIFDKLIVLVAKNFKKKGFLPIEKRVELIEQSINGLKNVEVDSFEGLTVDYANKHDAKYLLRGMRSASDFDNEMQISKVNALLNPDIKTVVLLASSENSAVSSSVVRDLFANNGDFKRFVPKPVADYLDKLSSGVNIK